MFKKILNNQHGMSLMEVMIAASISIVVAMGVMKINETSQKGLISVKLGSELDLMVKNIQGHMLSRDRCTDSSFATLGHDWEGGATPADGVQPPDVSAPQAFTEFATAGNQLIIRTNSPSVPPAAAVPAVYKTFTVGETTATPLTPWAPNWYITRYRLYDQDANGICYILIETSKKQARSSFGAELKENWIAIDCTLNPAGNVITTCVGRDTFSDGKWQDNPQALKGGIITYQLPVILGADASPNASAVIDIFPTPGDAGGHALTDYQWAETAPVQNGAIGVGIRVPYRTSIIFGNDGNSVGFYGEADSIYTNSESSLGVGSALSTGTSITSGTTITSGTDMASGGTMTSASTITSGTSITSGTTITSGTDMASGGTITSASTIASGTNITSATTLTVGTSATIANGLTVTSGTSNLRNTSINGTLGVTGNTTLATTSTGIISTGNALVGGILTVNGVTSINSNLFVSGSVWATAYNTFSDRALKRDIKKLTNATEKLSQIRGVTYFMRHEEFAKMKLSKDKQIGFIAQEIKEIFPEFVMYDDTHKLYSVDYSKITPVLVEGFKEQIAEIKKNRVMLELMREGIRIKNDEQDKRLDKLESNISRIDRLEKVNKELRSELKAVKLQLVEMMKLIEKKR
jgi:hypothetical protein